MRPSSQSGPRAAVRFGAADGTGTGRDTVDHGAGRHDDVCNAAMGALLLASGPDALERRRRMGGNEPSRPPPVREAPAEDHVWAVFPRSAVGTAIQLHAFEEACVLTCAGRTAVPEVLARSEAFQRHLGRFLVEG